MQLAWEAPVAWVACFFSKTVTVGELLVKNIEENKQEMLTSSREAVQAPIPQTLQREEIPSGGKQRGKHFWATHVCCEHNYMKYEHI